MRRVSLAIARGESVALVGHNGSGKSTLLKVLATVLTPTRGTVSVFGMDPENGGDDLRRRIGFMAHQPYAYRDLTALENLRFAAALYGVPRGEDELLELLRRVGLAGSARQLLRGFSQGMAQRLALARAVLHEPELLLLDEPYSTLDPDGAAMVDRVLEAHRAAGLTTVLVTHQVGRAFDLCGRVVVLAEGRVTFDGPVDRYTPAAQPAEGVV